MNDLPNYVTEEDMFKLYKGARKTRYPLRNKLILMMLYRHGLRETELCETRTDQILLDEARFKVQRIKNGENMTHPIKGDELRLIRDYMKYKQGRRGNSLPWFFVSERGTPLTRSSIIKTVATCAVEGGITDRKITPHMLRHGCGFYLANKGTDIRVIQQYLGHKNIKNTVLYTKLTGKQFEGLWD